MSEPNITPPRPSGPKMTLPLAMREGFTRWLDFSGRSSRAAYWYWALGLFLATAGASVLGRVLGIAGENGESVFTYLVYLAFLVPNMSILIRRLHDTGRTAAWAVAWFAGSILLTFLVLILGAGLSFTSGLVSAVLAILLLAPCLALLGLSLVLLYFTLQRGQADANRYGAPS